MPWIRSVKGLIGRLADRIHWGTLLQIVAVCAPLLIMIAVTADPRLVVALTLTVSGFIVCDRVGMPPLGYVAYAVLVVVVIEALFFARLVPPVFVAICVVLAAGAVRLSGWGVRLRSLGNFIFIPTVYVACEISHGLARDEFVPTAGRYLPYFLAASLLPLGYSVIRCYRHGHVLRVLPTVTGEPVPYTAGMIAGAGAVLCVAVVVEGLGVVNDQWMIWSALSVITSDVRDSHKKLRDRAIGATVGVSTGALAGLVLPHGVVVFQLASICALLTLVLFKDYILGFGARCFCIVVAVSASGGSEMTVGGRVFNVVLGGLIGVAWMVAVRAVTDRRATWRQDPPPAPRAA